jgi:hypothetical protein
MAAALIWGAAGATEPQDYPESARADYVFACVKANAGMPDAGERCACSFGVIANGLPYSKYVEAETVLSMSQETGRLGEVFRSTAPAKAQVDALRRAQAEAEVRCF